MNVHTVIRSVLVAFGVFISVYVTIPDYPRDASLFEVLAYDPNGWLHELFYVWVFVLSGVAIDAWYEAMQTLRNALTVWLAPYDPPTYRVRRIKKKGP